MSERIWKISPSPEFLNQWSVGTMLEHLDIRFVEVGNDFLKATMPVDNRTRQPFGLLHGGASVVLSESLGSSASQCCLDPKSQRCVGLEINANHIRSVKDGVVTGTVRPLHIGRKTHVWETRIHDAEDRLVAVSRLTVAVLDLEQ